MTDLSEAQESLIVAIDDDGIIVTFESGRLLGDNPRLEVGEGRIVVRDDESVLIDAREVDAGMTSALTEVTVASLVGVCGGDDGDDLFDVRANCPIVELEDETSQSHR